MNLQLNREFSDDFDEKDEESWSRFLGRDASVTWENLESNAVTVVLGEAGVGKTIEFQNRVNEVRKQGRFAFFIPLSDIIDTGSWVFPPEVGALYKKWESSQSQGIFFLDAIDESRLTNPSAFTRALRIIHTELMPQLEKISFVLSSRHTDWLVEEVREAVATYLCRPIYSAKTAPTVQSNLDEELTRPKELEVPPPTVVRMKPLSESDRYALTRFFGLQNESKFWEAITAGEHFDLAARPRDLKWLVSLWNAKGALGGYLELIENHIQQRLSETNQKYIQAQVAPSLRTLREGAEELAIVMELSGKYFVTTRDENRPNEIVARTYVL